MKKILLTIGFIGFVVFLSHAQNVTITDDQAYTADTSAILDVKSTTKGMLVPRVTTNQRNAIFEPATGLLVFDTDSSAFYFYDDAGWINLTHGSASDAWQRNSNNLYLSNDYKVGINKTNPISALEVKANATALDTDPLFQVINKTGDTVFAVFPDGVEINFDETTKGNIGGFAVSGRSATKGIRDYLRVSSDSTRIYLNEDMKGNIGGFAVSGRSATKNAYDEYLKVTPDSTNIFFQQDTKGNIGGFAVSGRSATKTNHMDYFNISANTTAAIVENESRIIWYPEKAAFLAGEVHVGSADSVGTNSTALGYRSISKGDYSQAFGYKSQALNTLTTAIGKYATATGESSYAFGDEAKSTGQESYAFGSGSEASGLRSYAFGSVGIDSAGVITDKTKAIGDYSFSFGLGSLAEGQGAFAIGTQNIASGNYSLSMGYQAKASGWYSTSVGNEAHASGYWSTSIGYKSESKAYYSIAIGYSALADTSYSTAVGSKTEAYGRYSTSIGYWCTANTARSSAFGYRCYASGSGATAIGGYASATHNDATAVGAFSSASGFKSTALTASTASGQYSVSMGRDAISSGYGSFAMGREIEAQGDYSFAFSLNDQNGTVVSQENTMAIMGGNVGIGTVSPGELFVVDNGTSVGSYTTSGWQHSSDKRLKTNIQNIPTALNKILNINGVYFSWKKHPAKKQIGFIAQDLKKIIPEAVTKNQNGYYTMSYGAITPVIVEAIKEQEEKISILEEENRQLRKEINEIKKLLK